MGGTARTIKSFYIILIEIHLTSGMELHKFHPTALYNPAGENPDFLVSEAVRGFGGILKNKDERRTPN